MALSSARRRPRPVAAGRRVPLPPAAVARKRVAPALALLPRERYEDASQPGCSVGVMTEQLARRCTRPLVCDVAVAVVKAAAARTSDRPGVRVDQRVLPDQWPDGDFDLIVFSEFLYYFGGPNLQRVLDLAQASLRPGGGKPGRRALAAPQSRNIPAVETTCTTRRPDRLSRLAEHREPDFIAEACLKGPLISVAQATGLT